MKRYTGWGYHGRVFTTSQFRNSAIKHNIKGMSYNKYVNNYVELRQKKSNLVFGGLK